jgi:HSP20 family protein
MIMNITRYEPMSLLNQFHKDLEKFLGMNQNGDSAIATSTWIPAVDIKEEVDRFLIEADIPGVDPKDIEISMESGVLTIRGERKAEQLEEGKGYKRVERAYGTFYRRFSLPDTADAEKVSASGKNGVLQITIPKKPVAQPRKIVVQQ